MCSVAAALSSAPSGSPGRGEQPVVMEKPEERVLDPPRQDARDLLIAVRIAAEGGEAEESERLEMALDLLLEEPAVPLGQERLHLGIDRMEVGEVEAGPVIGIGPELELRIDQRLDGVEFRERNGERRGDSRLGRLASPPRISLVTRVTMSAVSVWRDGNGTEPSR